MEMLKTMLIAAFVVFLGMEVANAKIQKISVKNVKPTTRAAGFQTFAGQILRTGDLEIARRRVIQAEKVIKGDFIEMKNGEIFYPEEIEFVFSIKAAKGPRIFKAPKEEERAPQDQDSN
ncbi:hypothetical protein A9Q84_06350 [Halobacteriovorax marinus]|uniref:Uncharacterized protein n=1 Tax=Halobacteriovorax marinus TaxID=97084 RepID=A0A1Y5F9L6_9BACT|nr:hypothetical protein A9Q84_06350 [Halobacteriovorax marinus]